MNKSNNIYLWLFGIVVLFISWEIVTALNFPRLSFSLFIDKALGGAFYLFVFFAVILSPIIALSALYFLIKEIKNNHENTSSFSIRRTAYMSIIGFGAFIALVLGYYLIQFLTAPMSL